MKNTITYFAPLVTITMLVVVIFVRGTFDGFSLAIGLIAALQYAIIAARRVDERVRLAIIEKKARLRTLDVAYSHLLQVQEEVDRDLLAKAYKLGSSSDHSVEDEKEFHSIKMTAGDIQFSIRTNETERAVLEEELASVETWYPNV